MEAITPSNRVSMKTWAERAICLVIVVQTAREYHKHGLVPVNAVSGDWLTTLS